MTDFAHRGRRAGPLALLSILAVGLLSAAAGLLLWTLVPVLFGWSSSVVVSGSMQPAIRAGDVVVTAPVPGKDIHAGYVIRFRDPSRPGRAVLHRVQRIGDDGRLITKGDANRVADSTPVPVGAVTGMGRLRVPYAGLPMLWWLRRDYPKVALTGLALMTLCLLVPAGWGWAGPPVGRHRRGSEQREHRGGVQRGAD
ncbi:signal peptidase I [Actinoplanes sp. L3-i22]|uniref:signal peptidase I n=1 Tax=Actinoplanes sp. L3-i22 TaxID=2836373 RepID=UPI001C75B2AE|nr:signal peptidase I [Actinoplanes sp. L3-i22]BCY06803.1 hypothetical protein L3i22_018910 [Actinoplanes sp. L3-i22]